MPPRPAPALLSPLVLRGRDAAAKLVVTDRTDLAEAAEAVDDLADLAPEVPLFLQGATPIAGVSAPGAEALDSLVDTSCGQK